MGSYFRLDVMQVPVLFTEWWAAATAFLSRLPEACLETGRVGLLMQIKYKKC